MNSVRSNILSLKYQKFHETKQEETVKFNWNYCYDFVTPLIAPLVLRFYAQVNEKQNYSATD